MPRVPKSPNNVASTLFNTVHLAPRRPRLEHWGAKLASWLIPVHPCMLSLKETWRAYCVFVIDFADIWPGKQTSLLAAQVGRSCLRTTVSLMWPATLSRSPSTPFAFSSVVIPQQMD